MVESSMRPALIVESPTHPTLLSAYRISQDFPPSHTRSLLSLRGALLFLFFFFLYSYGCGMESIQLLPDGSAQTETDPDASPNDNPTDTEASPTEDPHPKETTPETAVELPPPDATCPNAQGDEIQIWLSPKKDSLFLIGKAGTQGASASVRFVMPPFWVPTPSILWSDAQGLFAAKITLDLQNDQDIFVQAATWCRKFNISLLADRMRERYLESISIPILRVGQSTTLRFRLLGIPASNPVAFSSHPQIAQIENVTSQRTAQETLLSVSVRARTQGSFTLLVFDPSSLPFTVQLNVE